VTDVAASRRAVRPSFNPEFLIVAFRLRETNSWHGKREIYMPLLSPFPGGIQLRVHLGLFILKTQERERAQLFLGIRHIGSPLEVQEAGIAVGSLWVQSG
jgi:hypothetical protein